MVVGSSVAGVRTAQALRTEGFDGPLTLIGAEAELPYDRPPLSKEFLATGVEPRSFRLMSAESARDAGITLALGRSATRLDLARRRVEIDGGEPVDYTTLVIATGSRARPSPWRIGPSGAGPAIHTLRTIEDSRRLRASLLAGGPVVVIGAGFIGSEVASTARRLGLDVTLVDPLPVPMSRVLNEEIGAWFVDLHHARGVRTIFGTGVADIARDDTQVRVHLSDGQVLAAATVVVGIGAEPDTGWLESSGLLIDDGVVCDQYCRAVDSSDVFAVGDVARWFHPALGTDTRAEHWTSAVDQALCVGHNIAHPDQRTAFAPVPYVWSDQYDWKIQVVGCTTAATDHTVVGSAGHHARFAALYADDHGRLCGAATVNWPRALLECRRALRASGSVTDVRDGLEHRLAQTSG